MYLYVEKSNEVNMATLVERNLSVTLILIISSFYELVNPINQHTSHMYI